MKDVKNLHVPLSVDVHGALKDAAARTGKSATALAREAIERYLRELKKQAVDAAVEAWAREMAGSEMDLDPMLGDAGLEFLRESSEDA